MTNKAARKGRHIMSKTQNLQELILNGVRREKQQSIIFLVNGFQLKGTVTGFDDFTVIIDTEGKQQMIYKHAISTVVPASPVDTRPETVRE